MDALFILSFVGLPNVSATFFFHSNELKIIPILATDSKVEKEEKAKLNIGIKANITFFEKLINTKKYHFVNYYDAMKTRYK